MNDVPSADALARSCGAAVLSSFLTTPRGRRGCDMGGGVGERVPVNDGFHTSHRGAMDLNRWSFLV
jgi:hypothetical protein